MEYKCSLKREFGLWLALPDRCAGMRLYTISDHAGALAGGRRGVHAEAADAAAVHCSVRAVSRCERQTLEDRRVKHPQAV